MFKSRISSFFALEEGLRRELAAGGLCADGVALKENVVGVIEGGGAAKDFAAPVVAVDEFEVNATLSNGFGLVDCDICSLFSLPELNENNDDLALVVAAGLARVVNANGFEDDADEAGGASEDEDGVIVPVPAPDLLNLKSNDKARNNNFHINKVTHGQIQINDGTPTINAHLFDAEIILRPSRTS